MVESAPLMVAGRTVVMNVMGNSIVVGAQSESTGKNTHQAQITEEPLKTRMVDIPFSPEMRLATIEGRKLCTSRNKRYGGPGDHFTLDGSIYRILDVQVWKLKDVAAKLYRLEGFDTPQQFIDIWNKLHYMRGWEPDKEVFVHFFAFAL